MISNGQQFPWEAVITLSQTHRHDTSRALCGRLSFARFFSLLPAAKRQAVIDLSRALYLPAALIHLFTIPEEEKIMFLNKHISTACQA
jgi:hypothetical protein